MGARCDRYCADCRYLGVTAGNLKNCRYWELEDRLRGCPAGTGCDKKKTVKVKAGRKYIPTTEGGGMPPGLKASDEGEMGPPQDDRRKRQGQDEWVTV